MGKFHWLPWALGHWLPIWDDSGYTYIHINSTREFCVKNIPSGDGNTMYGTVLHFRTKALTVGIGTSVNAVRSKWLWTQLKKFANLLARPSYRFIMKAELQPSLICPCSFTMELIQSMQLAYIQLNRPTVLGITKSGRQNAVEAADSLTNALNH